ncbi:MAG: hypothetical protein PHV55_05900, partial [Candidatus Omnitrophica bacterium]|nr:hypothetical protein [Candidatus Omnitrophota bacterium]
DAIERMIATQFPKRFAKDRGKGTAHPITAAAMFKAAQKYPGHAREFTYLGETLLEIVEKAKAQGIIAYRGPPQEYEIARRRESRLVVWSITEEEIAKLLRDTDHNIQYIIFQIRLHELQPTEEEAIAAQVKSFNDPDKIYPKIDYLIPSLLGQVVDMVLPYASKRKKDKLREFYRKKLMRRDYIGRVAFCQGVPVGFIMYRLFEKAGTKYIRTIHVHTEFAGRGVHEALFFDIGASVFQGPYSKVCMIINEYDAISRERCHECGFREGRLLPGKFKNSNGIEMVLRRDESALDNGGDFILQKDLVQRRAENLRSVFRRLSIGAKRILLRPDIFAVFLGVKPAYIRYEDIDVIPFYDEILRYPEICQNYSLLFLDNYIVDLDYFMQRLTAEGDFLVAQHLLAQSDYEWLLRQGINSQSIAFLSDFLEDFTECIPGRGALHGFILGFSTQDILCGAEYEMAADGQEPRVDVLINRYGLSMLRPENSVGSVILELWDSALTQGYLLFEQEPDFKQAMLAEVLNAFYRVKNYEYQSKSSIDNGGKAFSASTTVAIHQFFEALLLYTLINHGLSVYELRCFIPRATMPYFTQFKPSLDEVAAALSDTAGSVSMLVGNIVSAHCSFSSPLVWFASRLAGIRDNHAQSCRGLRAFSLYKAILTAYFPVLELFASGEYGIGDLTYAYEDLDNLMPMVRASSLDNGGASKRNFKLLAVTPEETQTVSLLRQGPTESAAVNPPSRGDIEIIIEEEKYLDGIPDQEYADLAIDFVRALSTTLSIKALKFSRSGNGPQEEFIRIYGSAEKDWENVSLHIFILNPDARTSIDDFSCFREPYFILPRSYLANERIRRTIIDLAREGVVVVNLSEHSAFAPVDSVVTILEEGLGVIKKAKVANPAVLGEINLTWIEEEKSIVTPAVSQLPRMGYVLHPRIMLWPKSGIGIALEVSRDSIKRLASADSIFDDNALSRAAALIVPFSLAPGATFKDYLCIVQKIRGLTQARLMDLQHNHISAETLLSGPVDAQDDQLDTRAEDLQIKGAVTLPVGYRADTGVFSTIGRQRESAFSLESEIKRLIPTFSLELVILATLKGQDEKALFRNAGRETSVLCFDQGVLVVNPVAFARLYYGPDEERTQVFDDATRADLRFETLLLRIEPLDNGGFSLASPKLSTEGIDTTRFTPKNMRKLAQANPFYAKRFNEIADLALLAAKAALIRDGIDSSDPEDYILAKTEQKAPGKAEVCYSIVPEGDIPHTMRFFNQIIISIVADSLSYLNNVQHLISSIRYYLGNHNDLLALIHERAIEEVKMLVGDVFLQKTKENIGAQKKRLYQFTHDDKNVGLMNYNIDGGPIAVAMFLSHLDSGIAGRLKDANYSYASLLASIDDTTTVLLLLKAFLSNESIEAIVKEADLGYLHASRMVAGYIKAAQERGFELTQERLTCFTNFSRILRDIQQGLYDFLEWAASQTNGLFVPEKQYVQLPANDVQGSKQSFDNGGRSLEQYFSRRRRVERHFIKYSPSVMLAFAGMWWLLLKKLFRMTFKDFGTQEEIRTRSMISRRDFHKRTLAAYMAGLLSPTNSAVQGVESVAEGVEEIDENWIITQFYSRSILEGFAGYQKKMQTGPRAILLSRITEHFINRYAALKRNEVSLSIDQTTLGTEYEVDDHHPGARWRQLRRDLLNDIDEDTGLTAAEDFKGQDLDDYLEGGKDILFQRDLDTCVRESLKAEFAQYEPLIRSLVKIKNNTAKRLLRDWKDGIPESLDVEGIKTHIHDTVCKVEMPEINWYLFERQRRIRMQTQQNHPCCYCSYSTRYFSCDNGGSLQKKLQTAQRKISKFSSGIRKDIKTYNQEYCLAHSLDQAQEYLGLPKKGIRRSYQNVYQELRNYFVTYKSSRSVAQPSAHIARRRQDGHDYVWISLVSRDSASEKYGYQCDTFESFYLDGTCIAHGFAYNQNGIIVLRMGIDRKVIFGSPHMKILFAMRQSV